jgi:hypothetical protein
MTLDPNLVRLLWSATEDISSYELLRQSDAALVAMLLQQVSRRILLNREDIGNLRTYIGASLPLIRDIADSRWQIV